MKTNTTKENMLYESLYSRIKHNFNDSMLSEFFIYYKKNIGSDLSFESMCKIFFKAAEYVGIEESFIQEAIDDIKQVTKQIPVSFDPLSNVQKFYEEKPFFYDKSQIFWLWNQLESKYEIADEVDIMNNIDNCLGLYVQTINSKIKNEYLECFKRIGRKNIPKPTPTKWIQFKNKAISLKSNNIYKVTPDYFFTNPIPWDIGESEETPTMDKLFTDWVGEEYKQDLYEIIAYCCYRDYPIQVMLCLYGCGRNGKSQYLKIINKFLGIKNICSTELDLLAGNNSSRFEIFKLYKKLACMLGETNFGILSTTSMLKKLTGGDVIGFEKKGKDPFDDYNYAKIIISSNSLPSTDDSSDGFMRRWHIIDFPNEFPEGKDIINSIPEIEYNNLAKKVCSILPKLIERGHFKNQGDIEKRKTKYMLASNPLPIFINQYCLKDSAAFESYNKLYTEYVKYLIKHKKRKVKMKEFKNVLENEGFYVEKTAFKINEEFKNGYYVIGLKLRFDNFDNFDCVLPLITHRASEWEFEQKSQNCQKITDFSNQDTEKQIIVEEKVYSEKPTITHTILQNLSKQPKDIEVLYRNDCLNFTKDVFDTAIESLKLKGEIIENPKGYISRLE